jgi:CreA protein
MRKTGILFCAAMLIPTSVVFGEEIGEVSTRFKWMGPNDKIVVEVFQDPEVPGVACYLSRAKTGGISGAVGIAEDTSDASIACRQVGPVSLPEEVTNGQLDGQEVFKKRTSLFTKTMQVVRFYDPPRHTLVYLTYSDRIIEGSPKNSISVVVIVPWSSAASPQQGSARAREPPPEPANGKDPRAAPVQEQLHVDFPPPGR